MAHGSAGRGSRGCERPLQLLLLLLVLRHSRPSAGFLHVKMAGTTQTVLLNNNAAIFCQIYGHPSLNITIMGITWFWKGLGSPTEVKLYEFFGGHQMTARYGAVVPPESLERGNASLLLPRVQLREAGEYRCEVVITPYKAVGRIKLEVVASPVSSLFPEQAMVKENQKTLILCMSSGFHLKNITIRWRKLSQKDPQEVSEGIVTNYTIENGMLNVTSFLMLKPSLEDSMTIYQCMVYHKFLPTPQKLNFTLTVIESEKTDFNLKGIPPYIEAISALLILFFIIILLIIIFFKKVLPMLVREEYTQVSLPGAETPGAEPAAGCATLEVRAGCHSGGQSTSDGGRAAARQALSQTNPLSCILKASSQNTQTSTEEIEVLSL